ncbi:LPXTG-site transpeptidase (sortase) family protein [Seinonella peptonophila]|uniref:LPXTG-site transpeptidase (Sortase) family protein n=1 Tax=Seinonella peptonophila TaxID=112248 RepID=A0A1M4XP20_9BACL|nr:class D sortase [Seinonella peptonophila]SHE95249.1 LPXTG-site transpeptidase (sortase) family protein [Seinonella peptonophila]
MMLSDIIPRVVAWIMIVTGLGLGGYNGYQWWDQSNPEVDDPQLAAQVTKISKNWNSTKEEKSLTTVGDSMLNQESPTPDQTTNNPPENQNTTQVTPNQQQQQPEKTEQPKQQQPEQQQTQTKPQQTQVEKKPTTQVTTHKPDKIGSKIGTLYIPRMGKTYPIIEGTDDNSLKKGVGKYIGYGTVAPDQTGHVVLSGHRDTVFRGLNKVVKGDKLYVHYHGKIYAYQVRKIWRVNKDDRTVIVPTKTPVLTLTTCYPFDFVGSAPERYIIQSDLIPLSQ